MSIREQLDPFMKPRSVALLGVSRRTGEEAFNILENMLNTGYRGKLYPVNPNVTELLGLHAFPTVKAIADPVDLAVVTTPRDLALPMIRECLDKGIRAITVVAQGFADTGEQGRAQQREMTRVARSGGARVIGPNTFGTANAFANFNTAFVPARMLPIPIGLICQTGVFFVGFPGLVLLGKGFDLGNACDVDHAEALEYFEDDPEVRLVVLHIEGLSRGERLLEVARHTTKKKPVLVWKTGATEQAARMAQSHTGSLAGKDAVWDAALRRSGVLRVRELDELRDLVKGFTCLPPLRGRNIGVVTFTGGYAIMALDACAHSNIGMPPLGTGARAIIAGMSPPWLHVGNPVDIWPAMSSRRDFSGMADALVTAFRAVLSEPQVHALLFIGGAFASRWTRNVCQLLIDIAAQFPSKPVTAYFYGQYATEADEVASASGRVAVFPSVERAVHTLSRLAEYQSQATEPVQA
ncbi:MAG: CoA-binding protein [Chloroflexota bacterium]